MTSHAQLPTEQDSRETASVEEAVLPGGRSPKRRPSQQNRFAPLLWLGPCLALLVGVVIYPMLELVRTSFADISMSGVVRGTAGWENYARLFAEPDIWRVFAQTAGWVVAVVGLTVVLAWPVALLLNVDFRGRALVRYALIVPWAASLVMTSLVWKWMYNYYYGAINSVLTRLQVIDAPRDWLGDPSTSWAALVVVGVTVSVPFTAYVLLAGLQTIPQEVREAAAIDGAGPAQAWWHVTVPLLRPSLLIAVVLNIVGVFNSFPIIWLLTQGGPGSATDTTITYMYKLAFRSRDIGESAALSVVNILVLLLVVLLYLRSTRATSREF